MQNGPISISDVCEGNVAEMSWLERAIWNSKQGLLNSLGIASSTLFALSTRQLRAGADPKTTLRRASDSKTTKLGLRPNVAYDAPRNLLHYDPVTWAEWTLSARNSVSGNALTFTPDGINTTSANIAAIAKTNTKYGVILNVPARGSSYFEFDFGSSIGAGGFYANLSVGNNKIVGTTGASIASNRFTLYQGVVPVGQICTIRDIRVFELPTGSQIEADFTNLTGDALAVKYQMVGSSGASLTAKPGKPKSRVCNEFANGDGRYGTIGWEAGNATLSAKAHGVRGTGNGADYALNVYAGKTTGLVPAAATRKLFVKGYAKRTDNGEIVSAITYNGTTQKTVSITGQVSTTGSWFKAIITQTDAGTYGLLAVIIQSYFPNAATQNEKTLDVEYFTISIMGDTAADPHYNDTAEQYDAWLRTQPGAIPTPDGEYYLAPYGLQAGESCLDCAVAFGGTSQLYCSAEEGQAVPADNASQATIMSQPKWYDNGLRYPGGLFDGSDDYEVADLPDITTGPATWMVKCRTNNATKYLFSRAGNGYAEIQYGVYYNSTAGELRIILNGGNETAIATPPNTDIAVAFVWNGTTITAMRAVGGSVLTGTPNAFAGPLVSRPNKFIGALSAAADGSTRVLSYGGTLPEILIVPEALTPSKFLKLC